MNALERYNEARMRPLEEGEIGISQLLADEMRDELLAEVERYKKLYEHAWQERGTYEAMWADESRKRQAAEAERLKLELAHEETCRLWDKAEAERDKYEWMLAWLRGFRSARDVMDADAEWEKVTGAVKGAAQ